MVKVLAVCENIGKSATGLVIESIFKYLDENPTISLTILCNQNLSDIEFNDLVKVSFPKQKIDVKYKISLIVFGKEPNANEWVKSAFKEVKDRSFDVILAITSAYSIRSFQFANYFGVKKQIPYLLHALDPMPSVKGWGEHPILRSAIIRSVKSYYEHASLVSASNLQMIDYQCKKLKLNDVKKSFFYNPSKPMVDTIKIQPLKRIDCKKEVKLLYLGTLYRKRYSEHLLQSIQKLNNDGINTSISFVGQINDDDLMVKLTSYSFVKVAPFQEDISDFIKDCDVLVDIDANISNDVFISSKLNNYLSIPRPILSITPFNSPSENFVKVCKKTIKTVNHDVENIYEAIKSLLNSNNFDYTERRIILEDLSINSVGEKILNRLNKLVNLND